MRAFLLLGLHLTSGLIPQKSDPAGNLFCGTPIKDNGIGNSRVKRVINGEQAEEFQFPWMVGIFSGPHPDEEHEEPNSANSRTGFGGPAFEHVPACSGTILSSRTILTSDHCIHRIHDSKVWVGFPNGSTSFHDAKRIPSLEFHEHLGSTTDTTNEAGNPKFSAHIIRPIYDFTIITLAEPIEFSAGTLPVCLPDPMKNYDNVEAIFGGWGSTSQSHAAVSVNDLQVLNMTTLSNKDCQKVINEEEGYQSFRITSSTICAQSQVPGGGACFGADPGGMLITMEEGGFYSLLGSLSYGPVPFCASKDYNVFASITNQLYWIANKFEGETLPPPVKRTTRY